MQKKRKAKPKVGRRGKPVKIPATFDTAMDGFLAVVKPKTTKRGRVKDVVEEQ